MSVGEEESNSVREKDTLLHGETLLVVSTGDSENVSLPLVTDAVVVEEGGDRGGWVGVPRRFG